MTSRREWKEKAALVPTCLDELAQPFEPEPAADEAAVSEAHRQVRRPGLSWPQRMADPRFNGFGKPRRVLFVSFEQSGDGATPQAFVGPPAKESVN